MNGSVRQTADMLAKPRPDGTRPKTSFMLEKGIYWCNNLGNTTSFSALGLLCGAGNRPGRVIARGGPDAGRRRSTSTAGVLDGHVRFAWVIGTTWLQAMAASQELIDVFVLTSGGDNE